MKTKLAVALISLALCACSNPKEEEKAALDQVIKVHDKVMGLEDQLMHNKMKLDTLMAEAKNEVARDKISELKNKLAKADAAMSDWMQHFEPVPQGKNHEQLMSYFENQKQQAIAVDTMFVKAIKESADYLKPFEKK